MRYLGVVVLLLSAVSAGAAWYTQRYTQRSGEDWQAAISSLQRERDRGRQLDIQLRQQHDFAAYCQRRLFEMMIGRIRLVHACRDIERYARVHWPAFLERMEMLGKGRTLREKLAHNLAGSFLIRRSANSGWERDSTMTMRIVVEIAEATATP